MRYVWVSCRGAWKNACRCIAAEWFWGIAASALTDLAACFALLAVANVWRMAVVAVMAAKVHPMIPAVPNPRHPRIGIVHIHIIGV